MILHPNHDKNGYFGLSKLRGRIYIHIRNSRHVHKFSCNSNKNSNKFFSTPSLKLRCIAHIRVLGVKTKKPKAEE